MWSILYSKCDRQRARARKSWLVMMMMETFAVLGWGWRRWGRGHAGRPWCGWGGKWSWRANERCRQGVQACKGVMKEKCRHKEWQSGESESATKRERRRRFRSWVNSPKGFVCHYLVSMRGRSVQSHKIEANDTAPAATSSHGLTVKKSSCTSCKCPNAHAWEIWSMSRERKGRHLSRACDVKRCTFSLSKCLCLRVCLIACVHVSFSSEYVVAGVNVVCTYTCVYVHVQNNTIVIYVCMCVCTWIYVWMFMCRCLHVYLYIIRVCKVRGYEHLICFSVWTGPHRTNQRKVTLAVSIVWRWLLWSNAKRCMSYLNVWLQVRRLATTCRTSEPHQTCFGSSHLLG